MIRISTTLVSSSQNMDRFSPKIFKAQIRTSGGLSCVQQIQQLPSERNFGDFSFSCYDMIIYRTVVHSYYGTCGFRGMSSYERKCVVKFQ